MTLCASACEPVFFPFIGILAETITSIRLSLVIFPPDWKTPLTGCWALLSLGCWRNLLSSYTYLTDASHQDFRRHSTFSVTTATSGDTCGCNRTFFWCDDTKTVGSKMCCVNAAEVFDPRSDEFKLFSVWIVTSEFWVRYLKEQLIPRSEVRVYFLLFRWFLYEFFILKWSQIHSEQRCEHPEFWLCYTPGRYVVGVQTEVCGYLEEVGRDFWDFMYRLRVWTGQSSSIALQKATRCL